jgi:hypothetical protein
MPEISEQGKRDCERYAAAMHGVQSAIALEIEQLGEKAAGANAKHLRTGINSCLVDSSAIATLLIGKGIFTQDEYFAAIAEAAERELATMTDRVRKSTGIPNVSFG